MEILIVYEPLKQRCGIILECSKDCWPENAMHEVSFTRKKTESIKKEMCNLG